DSRRHSHLNRFFHRNDAPSSAVVAWRCRLAGTPAPFALRRSPSESAGRLSSPLATRTGDPLPRLLAGCGARGTGLVVLDFNSFCRAVHGLLERYRQRIFHVGSPLRLRPGLRLSANPAEKLGKDVFKAGCPKAGEIKTGRSSAPAGHLVRVISE